MAVKLFDLLLSAAKEETKLRGAGAAHRPKLEKFAFIDV